MEEALILKLLNTSEFEDLKADFKSLGVDNPSIDQRNAASIKKIQGIFYNVNER